ncbi:hypothetical protein CP532_3558 [Ophiocordyceps camponoti-leonardi (nom. inval.)]|nr:hypothetical protein CP532_3558 [Ophiocordyceps camponoti-leonardi (nom. inval.)]
MASDTSSAAATAAATAHGLSASTLQDLTRKAKEAKFRAYCPYSNFRVGAAVLHLDGETVTTGANVENASYPVGTCAERVALSRAVVEGGEEGEGGGGDEGGRRRRRFRALAVASDVSPAASPIREFCDPSIPIVLVAGDDGFEIVTLEQLLPMSFGPEHLSTTTTKTA